MAATAGRVGFIGSGRIAQMLTRGFISAGLVQPESVTASDKDPKTLDLASRHLGVNVTDNNNDVMRDSHVIYLAVKPPQLRSVVSEVADEADPERHLFVSLAAGMRTDTVESLLPPGCRVVRVMPNTPAFVHCGASMYSSGVFVTDRDRRMVESHLRTVGICEEVGEELMDAVTGVSGSGPAYGYLAIEGMADGGVRMGLPRPLAIKLAAQTLMGAAKMILETGQHPGQLKDDVCSPGGTTIAAVHQLEKSGIRIAYIEAVRAAAERSRALDLELNGAKKIITSNSTVNVNTPKPRQSPPKARVTRQ